MRGIVLALLLACAANGQWVYLKTEGVPRTKDGKLNAKAPPPRTAWGTPDFSGTWWARGPHMTCPASIGGDADCAEKGLGLAGQEGAGLTLNVTNIANTLKDPLPYTPWAIEEMKRRAVHAATDDPHVHCISSYVPRMYTLPHMQEFVQTPKLLVMLNEFNAAYRRIHIDGRKLPVDPVPAWNGYSTAYWEKDTLVIETSGFRDDLWLDTKGNPLTSAAKMTERIRRPNFGTLEIELTINDPKAYTKPWTVKLEDFYVVDTDMMEEVCLEGEKSLQHMQNLK